MAERVYLRRVITNAVWLSSPQGGAVCPLIQTQLGGGFSGTRESAVVCFQNWGLTSEALQGRDQGGGRLAAWGCSREKRWLHWEWSVLSELTGQELTLRKEHTGMKETWQEGLHGKVRGQKKWVSGMGQLSGNERNFLRDQSERTLLSRVAIGKTSALMGVAENPPKEEVWEAWVSGKCRVTNPRSQLYLTS